MAMVVIFNLGEDGDVMEEDIGVNARLLNEFLLELVLDGILFFHVYSCNVSNQHLKKQRRSKP